MQYIFTLSLNILCLYLKNFCIEIILIEYSLKMTISDLFIEM